MWHYIKQLLQLLLSPSAGWEDVSAAGNPPGELQAKGYFPLVAVTALSQFLPLFYLRGLGFVRALENAVAEGVGMFVALYLARFFLDFTLPRFIKFSYNATKVYTFVIYLLGINCLFDILTNALPASMTFLKLLPLLAAIIIYKSNKYLGIPDDEQLPFTGLAIVALIVLPIALTALLTFII